MIIVTKVYLRSFHSIVKKGKENINMWQQSSIDIPYQQDSTAQHSTAQHSTAQTAQHSTGEMFSFSYSSSFFFSLFKGIRLVGR